MPENVFDRLFSVFRTTIKDSRRIGPRGHRLLDVKRVVLEQTQVEAIFPFQLVASDGSTNALITTGKTNECVAICAPVFISLSRTEKSVSTSCRVVFGVASINCTGRVRFAPKQIDVLNNAIVRYNIPFLIQNMDTAVQLKLHICRSVQRLAEKHPNLLDARMVAKTLQIITENSL